MKSTEATDTFEEINVFISHQLNELKARLPAPLIKEFDPHKMSADHLVCVLIGSLTWRTHEVAEDALAVLNRKNLVSSAALTRVILECAATMGALRGYIEKRRNFSDEELYNTLEKLAFGSRAVGGHDYAGGTIPTSINITTHLDKLIKHEPTVKDNYDFMSELCHPNGTGVMGIYCHFNNQLGITTFGRNTENIEILSIGCARNLTYSLRVFIDEFDKNNSECIKWLESFETRSDGSI